MIILCSTQICLIKGNKYSPYKITAIKPPSLLFILFYSFSPTDCAITTVLMIKVGFHLHIFSHLYMSAVQVAKLTVQSAFISHGENQFFNQLAI